MGRQKNCIPKTRQTLSKKKVRMCSINHETDEEYEVLRAFVFAMVLHPDYTMWFE